MVALVAIMRVHRKANANFTLNLIGLSAVKVPLKTKRSYNLKRLKIITLKLL